VNTSAFRHDLKVSREPAVLVLTLMVPDGIGAATAKARSAKLMQVVLIED
jgi:hypothetical protein